MERKASLVFILYFLGAATEIAVLFKVIEKIITPETGTTALFGMIIAAALLDAVFYAKTKTFPFKHIFKFKKNTWNRQTRVELFKRIMIAILLLLPIAMLLRAYTQNWAEDAIISVYTIFLANILAYYMFPDQREKLEELLIPEEIRKKME